jgi:hypothetical protein
LKKDVEEVLGWVWKFMYLSLEHQAILLIISLIALIIIVVWRKVILEQLEYVFKKIYRMVKNFFLNWVTSTTIRLKRDNDISIAKITKDTTRYVSKLSDARYVYVAIQYLLQYPSPKGYRALIKVVVIEEEDDVRNNLLWLMHQKACVRWYKEIK